MSDEPIDDSDYSVPGPDDLDDSGAQTYDGDAPDQEQIDPALADKAVELVRAAVRGNGVKPQEVTLAGFDGAVLNFEAYGHYDIVTKTNEKHVTGQEKGEVVGSEHDLRVAVERSIKQLSEDPKVKKAVHAMVKKRKDRGFAVDGLALTLGGFHKVFVVHQMCHSCNGTANIPCPQCHGQKQEQCYKCHGSTDMVCPACRGQQSVMVNNGQRQQCMRCHGRGRMPCDICKATGHTQCRKCKATGKQPCQICRGTGWMSIVAHVDASVRGHFSYDREAVPPPVTVLVDMLGPELVTGGHAEAEPLENMPVPPDRKERCAFVLPYKVRVPWAKIGFYIREEKKAEGYMFGFVPELVHMNPFLESLTAAGRQELEEAAFGEGDTGAQIYKATRYRLIGDVCLAALRFHPKKAADLIHKKYSFGLQADTVTAMLDHADKALNKMTRKPRHIGLALGLAASALLYAFYYLGPGRVLLAPYLTQIAVEIVADAALLAAGGVMTTLTIQLTAARAARQALRRVIPKKASRAKKQKLLMPKAGRPALWGYAAGLVIYIIIVLGAAQAGMGPSWLPWG